MNAVEVGCAATLITTWLLSQQTLAATTTAPLEKGTRRAYARAQQPLPEVRLVRLRGRADTTSRPATDPGPESTAADASDSAGDREPGREYSHRWWVVEHFRDQPVGPGRRRRKRTYVVGHFAGPKDKPIRLRPSVNVLGSTRPTAPAPPTPAPSTPSRPAGSESAPAHAPDDLTRDQPAQLEPPPDPGA